MYCHCGGVRTFLDKPESVGDVALVGNEQQTTIMLGHASTLLVGLCHWSVGDSSSHHKMPFVIGEVISRPALPDMGSVRTSSLVLRVVSEGIRVIRRFQFFVFLVRIFTLFTPFLEQ